MRSQSASLQFAFLALAALTLLATAPVRAEDTPQTVTEPPKSPWGYGVGYTLNTDFASELDGRLFKHLLEASVSYDWTDVATFETGLGYRFISVGSSVSRYPEDSGFSYGSLIAKRSLRKDPWKTLGGEHTPRASLEFQLPLMEDARLEGYWGTLTGSLALKSAFLNKHLNFTQALMLSRTGNRYAYSPFTNDPSVTGMYGYKIRAAVPIVGDLTGIVGFGVRRTLHADGFQDFSFNNTQALSYELGKLSITLVHVNGGHVDESDKVDLWFVDKYRRIVTLSLEYEL